jgi:hypothetical protein
MRKAFWICIVLWVLATLGCTEPNPFYEPPDGGATDDATDGDTPVGPDADADVGPDADADVGPDADADVGPDADADVGPDADADVEPDVGPDADADVEPDVPPPDDLDRDGVPNAADNCPSVWNPGQEDCDTDGTGDRCEAGDTDGDTLADAVDVCTCGAGAGTHDEDGDTLADDCDNCPLVTNATQDNADFDGLGDSCEPPGEPDTGLAILRFEPFLALPTDPGWTEPGGTWAIGTDVYDQTDDGASAVAFYDGWDLGDDYFVQAVFRITALGSGGGGISKHVGLLGRAIGMTDGSVRWYMCALDGAHDRLDIRMWDGAAYSTLAQENVGTRLETGVDYRLSFRVLGSSLTCALESPVAAPVTASATNAALPTGAAGVRTYRAAGSFSGMLVAH